MAGRGRGRGRGTPISAIADTLGVGRGDFVNLGIMQPPPLYPNREFRPLPMPEDTKRKEDVAYKREFRQKCRKQPYYIRKPSDMKGVARYTDRYREVSLVTDNTIGWTPNWSKLPDELRIKVRSRRPGGAVATSLMRPNLAANRNRKAANGVDVKKTLEMLEAKENEDAEQDDNDEDDDELEEIDEDDEETDYIVAHDDERDEYGFEDDDGGDEGVDF